MTTKFIQRVVSPSVVSDLIQEGVPEVVAKLLAGRGITKAVEVDGSLSKMLRPSDLKGAKEAGELLADCLQQGLKISVVADYDCDGASACAVMLRGLTLLGARPGTVDYLVPDRQKDGYGLTGPIVDRVVELQNPHLIVTVDNGIASFDGIARAQELGLKTVVTDHHLPAVVDGQISIPNATVTVNPSQPGCTFGSKAICGAGVAFYTMLMTRAALRERGVFDVASQPRLDALLDLVALATVTDVVRLDENNRRLVAQGLERIRSERVNPGIRAVFEVAGRDHTKATSTDLGFTVGPRINAAGRLSDMTVGIACLLANDRDTATQLASTLQQINQERREVESGMATEAQALVEKLEADGEEHALVIFNEDNHEGVVGLLAGRIKEAHHKPTFVFARSHSGDLKGSGRSIPGFHLRDALDLVTKRHPNLILRFGGHAMAAGCTVRKDGLEQFREALIQVAKEQLTREMLERTVLHDGEFCKTDYTVELVKQICGQIWGSGFDAPVFVDRVKILEQRIVGNKHLKLVVSVDGQRRDGIWFGQETPVAQECTLAYQVGINVWQGRESVQMLVQGLA